MKQPPLWLRGFLRPLSLLYAFVTKVRRNWYERGFLSSFPLVGTVISIGNIEAGGTGKSPLTLELCTILRANGAKPVILTRGYKSGLSANESAVLLGEKVLLQAENTLNFIADEARMQAARLGDIPIILGRDRHSAAKRYLEHFPAPTHWILDDGFQHQRIRRDIDIVLLDAKKPFDNGLCLPAGHLREGKSSLKKADWLIFTRAESPRLSPEAEAVVSEWQLPFSSVAFISGPPAPTRDHAPPWQEIKAWTLALGVAKPERIEEGIRVYQLPIKHRHLVADHEVFDKREIARLLETTDALLTTEKDYWRDKQYFDLLPVPVYLIPLSLDWLSGAPFPQILATLTKNLPKK